MILTWALIVFTVTGQAVVVERGFPSIVECSDRALELQAKYPHVPMMCRQIEAPAHGEGRGG